ncbi:Hypothetical predicted protein [Pelobates cultripes]|uniref:Uncharacterized protein n=1 Tax=Pelobates cultripes TaxID=61616 RepID=A0AAD1RAI6_PELCU|nr:Hypothetical predicted protein [Pelobates cultripes]
MESVSPTPSLRAPHHVFHCPDLGVHGLQGEDLLLILLIQLAHCGPIHCSAKHMAPQGQHSLTAWAKPWATLIQAFGMATTQRSSHSTITAFSLRGVPGHGVHRCTLSSHPAYPGRPSQKDRELQFPAFSMGP